MKKAILFLFFVGAVYGQSATEFSVLKNVQQMFKEEGRVTFSSLYNSDRFSGDEKAFLGRLYEIFFAIPGFLKSEFESTGKVPTRASIAEGFGVSPQSIELLLVVMEGDSRVPPLFTRSLATREIESLNVANIDAFLAAKGSNVKMTQWEGKPLPAFSLETLGGAEFSSHSLMGKNALLYFWFTGCPPCVRIAPILSELAAKYGPSGVQFLGINADDVLEIGTSNESRKAYLEGQGISFTNLNLDAQVKESFGSINVYPTLFVVGKDGIIQSHLVNFQSKEKIEGLLVSLQE